MKILIVDDISEDRRLLRYIAERQGHEVLEAENGEVGLMIAISQLPDLIISDALMPVMDGFMFLHNIRADATLRDKRFIFYSAAYQGEKDVQFAHSLGADGYIIKPRDPRELWLEVETILRAERPRTDTPDLVTDEKEYLRQYSQRVLNQLEQKVRESEERESLFRTLAENLPANIVRYDRNCRIIFTNRYFIDFQGVSGDTFIGKTPEERFPKGEGPMADYFSTLRQVLETGEGAEIEFEPPGRQEVHLIRFAAERDSEGRIFGAIAVGRDITGQKKAQARLEQKSEELAQTNAALTVLLNRSRQVEAELQANMALSLEKLLIPAVNYLENSLNNREAARTCLVQIKAILRDISTPFARKVASPLLGLSPREIQIADLIKAGSSSKEIANALSLSVGTVEFYRDRIRQKLDIKNRKTNLRSFLVTQFTD